MSHTALNQEDSLNPKQLLASFFGRKQEQPKETQQPSSYSEDSQQERQPQAQSKGTSVIGAGTTIIGNIQSEANIRIDGRIEGEVNCEVKIVMGKEGQVKGKVEAGSLVVEGQIEGEINCSGQMHLAKTAVINGNFQAKNLSVDPGAAMNGECSIA